MNIRAVAILEVNTVSLRLTALKKSGSVFGPAATVNAAYAGLEGQNFIRPDKLFNTILQMFSDLAEQGGAIAAKVNVILPQCLMKNFLVESSVSLDGRQVRRSDLANLYKKCVIPSAEYTVVRHVPVSFRSLDNPVMHNPIGQACDKLYASVSCSCVHKLVKEFFDNVAKRLKKTFVYWGESDEAIRNLDQELKMPGKSRLLINLRQEHFSVNLCKGGGIIASGCAEWGANHVIYAIMDLLKCEKPLASRLAHKLNLNVDCDADDVYAVFDGENLMEFNMKAINDRVKDTLSYMSGKIKGIAGKLTLESSLPVYLTGSGICEVRGAADCLTGALRCENAAVLRADYAGFLGAENYIIAAGAKRLEEEKVSIF